MAHPKPFLKRKKFFINPRVQGLVLRRCAVFWFVYHFLMLHTLFAVEFMKYQLSIMNGGNVVSFLNLYSDFLSKYAPLVITSLAMLPVVAIDVLKMSHRIVGPLIPFQRAMQRLKNGEQVDEVQIRNDDLLVEFQQDFNEFLAWYRQQHAELRGMPTASVQSSNVEELQILSDVETLDRQVVDLAGQQQPEADDQANLTEQPAEN